MDLKFYIGKIILHLLDHAARLSPSCFVSSKEPKVIINGIFRSWMQNYEMPEQLLSDNRGEFENSNFIDMYKLINIVFKLTAAGAPFSKV